MEWCYSKPEARLNAWRAAVKDRHGSRQQHRLAADADHVDHTMLILMTIRPTYMFIAIRMRHVDAGTLTHSADSTQQLSVVVASASEEASTNVQSVASATEELTSSITEISRQGAGLGSCCPGSCRPGQQDQRARLRAIAGRQSGWRRGRVNRQHCWSDQFVGAKCYNRSCSFQRGRPRLCRSRFGSQGTCRTDG